MPTNKIMIVRHAEKPSADGSVVGIDANGSPNPEELTVRGWQRSGALIHLFSPAGLFTPGAPAPGSNIVTPAVIFASATAKHSNSVRPQHTVQALAGFLGIVLNLNHAKGEEDALVADAMSQDGPALIAWEHEAIPGIANRILGDTHTCPQQWPGDRFDVVWIFDRQPAGWQFSQAPQLLLSGDKNELISAD